MSGIPDSNRYYTIREISQLLRKHPNTIYRYINRDVNKLVAYQFDANGEYTITQEDFDDFLKRNKKLSVK